ncbi:hypothetical protein DDZ18_05045 [Marinicauda salina]|uniref:Uncharacterized protein n=1 Tax=Marinicauda salina TaxID=2135793 RepID=A0A2U2BV99_9PROT|nr:hypothetical protein [Marinicauda salina]PWE17943.1 hypothetical protein DDZ18_05045 [Marinicauda salina]
MTDTTTPTGDEMSAGDADATHEEGVAPRSSARPSDEMLPFLNNFHDIFTTIGILILLGGLGLGVGQLLGVIGFAAGTVAWQVCAITLIAATAIVLWGLSTILVGSQRRILPGIVLSLGFAGAAAAALIWLYVLVSIQLAGVDEEAFSTAFDAATGMEALREQVDSVAANLPLQVRAFPIVIALAFLAPVLAYYRSFRLPFAGGLVGAGLVGLAISAYLVAKPYEFIVYSPLINVIAGLALFVAGLVFDMRDPERATRLSGTGFWLHFFAAPTLLGAAVNATYTGWTLDESDFELVAARDPVTAAATGDASQAVEAAAVTLAVIAGFALVSLLINRRALIVAGLLTAGVSIGVLVSQVGLGVGAVVAITLLALGGVVVLLGAAWNPVRRVLLAPFPDTGPLARLFPPARAGAEG